MYPHVRLVAATAMVAFGTMIGAGALMVVPLAVEKVRLARAELSQPGVACQRQSWLHPDRSCVTATASRDEIPQVAEYRVSSAVAAEVPLAVAKAPGRPAMEREVGPQPSDRLAIAPEPVEVPRHEPVAVVPAEPVSSSDITAPAVGRPPIAPPRAAKRPAAKPVVRAQAPAPAARKAARPAQAARRSTNEALGVVRRFGDTLQDIPVTAYSGDGTQRRIIIRPTSVQDVYYYSVRRQ